MKIHFPLIFLTVLCFLNCEQKTTTLYVGTYTDGDSEGIYQFQFNSETGALTNKQLATISENPSFITYSPDKKYLYAVNETDNGAVSAFKVASDDALSFINKASTHGANPCHVALNENGNKAVVSNYTGGNFALYTVKNDGTLTEAFQILDQTTDSMVSHAHSAQFYNDELYTSNLGRNAVFNYRLSNNTYELIAPSIVEIDDNSGPRHFSLTKDGKFIYIINELSSTITAARKIENGFERIETVSTLDPNFKGESYCADIHLSEDEQFLYGSNRGENSIVVFKRDATSGALNRIQNIQVNGDWPRNFTLDPTGKFILVANQKSNNIAVFKVDKTNGELRFLHEVELPSPVCLLF
ncbi:lactonase family protein [Gelidibacter mesophilus]|uniref:lactonase family protein n=1 Tax=Gelidibacter mesophilus TaxID=169050 RepID=UPI00040D8D40|nr:lactonase family protein [Gelidibacter mesophilus]